MTQWYAWVRVNDVEASPNFSSRSTRRDVRHITK
jgi:hypothetical protein